MKINDNYVTFFSELITVTALKSLLRLMLWLQKSDEHGQIQLYVIYFRKHDYLQSSGVTQLSKLSGPLKIKYKSSLLCSCHRDALKK